MNRLSFGARLLTGTALALLMTGVASAQTQPALSASDEADHQDQVGDIVVTAQRRSEAVNDIPLAVAVIGSEELQDRGFVGTEDLSRLVAGFSFVNTGVNAPVYSLRGVGYYESSLAATPTVSVYVDEVPLPYPAMTQGAALDLERVEVLKGPQGTLYGQNSTGGLVNYIARKPDDVFGYGATATYGRFNEASLAAFVTGPVAASLNARLAVQAAAGDGWQRSYTRDDTNGQVERLSARLQLAWTPSDATEIVFDLNGWTDRSDTIAPQLIAIRPNNLARLLPIIRDAPLAPANARAANWNPGQDLYRDDSLWQASVKGNWFLTDELTLSSITAYTDYTTNAYNERDGTEYENSEYPTIGSISSFYQELRLAGQAEDFLQWQIGTNYHEDESRDRQNIRYSTASNVQNVNGFRFLRGDTKADQEASGYSVFANGDWSLRETLTLTTGVRYSQESRDLSACSLSVDPNQLAAIAINSANNRARAGLPPAPFIPVNDCFTLNEVFLPDEIHKHLSEDNLSWRAALRWEPTPSFMVYTSAAQGYKSGSFPTQGSSTEVQYRPATQESIRAYEAGVKATLFDRSLQLNLSTFYYDYTDKQTKGRYIDPVFGPVQALVNIPESHSQGYEVEFQWVPFSGLNINGTLAHTDTEIDLYTGYTQLGVSLNFAGRPFSFTPKTQYTADVSYTWDLSGGLEAVVGASVVGKSETSADSFSDPLFNIDGYSLVDLRAGVSSPDSGWSAMVWGRNVGDVYYWTNVFKATDTVVRLAGRPATFGFTLSYNY